MRRWVLLAVALAIPSPRLASAQCGAKSSTCRACHELRKEGPAFDGALPWHRDHAFADLCPSCHGGDGQAKAAAAAHDGRLAPLADVQATCGLCHGDGAARAVAYERALGERDAGPSAPAIPAAVEASAPPRTAPGNRAVALVALVLGAFGSGLALKNERRRRSSRAP